MLLDELDAIKDARLEGCSDCHDDIGIGIGIYHVPTISDGGSCQQITQEVRAQEWFPETLPAEARLRVYLRQQVGQTGILQLPT